MLALWLTSITRHLSTVQWECAQVSNDWLDYRCGSLTWTPLVMTRCRPASRIVQGWWTKRTTRGCLKCKDGGLKWRHQKKTNITFSARAYNSLNSKTYLDNSYSWQTPSVAQKNYVIVRSQCVTTLSTNPPHHPPPPRREQHSRVTREVVWGHRSHDTGIVVSINHQHSKLKKHLMAVAENKRNICELWKHSVQDSGN